MTPRSSRDTWWSCERGDTSEFEAVFDTVERILREGDEEARAAAALGVLESVQVQSTHYTFGPEVYVKWLGPLSRQAWREVDALWVAGDGSLAGVVRLERSLQEMSRRDDGGGHSDGRDDHAASHASRKDYAHERVTVSGNRDAQLAPDSPSALRGVHAVTELQALDRMLASRARGEVGAPRNMGPEQPVATGTVGLASIPGPPELSADAQAVGDLAKVAIVRAP
ncbi:MAG TPA: hypothetical protein VGD94_14925 [Vicinamibacterales bacterium]